ncbi:MAG: aldehyde dehydrogenase family protein [Gammaproteobacteria bacterium]|nr:aldehyde dehydrogenase [Chromatiales bacterium]MCP4926081.1 aldehyde dehydrogenase family protein [Gammaproteobacteria bacterium]MDP7297067.1 aldehyde dehydrogenase family protein [Gammaproteobacteria bacterium]
MSALPENIITPAQETQEFLDLKHQLLIGGEWVAPINGGTSASEDPATETVITEVACGGAEDIDRAVVAARKALKGEWSTITTHERSRLIWKLADALETNLNLITELEVLDNGMPRPIAMYSIVAAGVNYLRYYAGWATKIHGQTIPVSPGGAPNGGTLTYTQREPIGVVGAITPWNAPLPMVILKLAPALAAGCTMILKPAEITPLTALMIGHLTKEVGIPDGVFNIVTGHGSDAGAALAEHDGVDKIAFTGSTEVGKIILKAAAGNLKKVTLELGGKSPVVVFPDADISRVIPGAARAAFFLQGQNCMAGTRMFVHDDVYEEVVNGVAAMANAFHIGHGLHPDTEIGPLISSDQVETVLGYIEAGKATNADLVCGGDALAGPGHFVQPTIFGQTTMDMKIAREEIFGPVLCIQKFADSDLDAIAEQCNSTIYGLSGSVWSQDISVAHQMVNKIDSGQVAINCHAAVDPAVPFGGNRQSGWGREMGEEGLDSYLKTKSTTVMF